MRRRQLALLGANTSCISPLPKSGRLTRSPGRGEQHLLDQVADVRVVVGLGGAAAAVEVVGKVDVAWHVSSRSRASAPSPAINGVPVGAQIAWLSSSTSGCAVDEHARRRGRPTAR